MKSSTREVDSGSNISYLTLHFYPCVHVSLFLSISSCMCVCVCVSNNWCTRVRVERRKFACLNNCNSVYLGYKFSLVFLDAFALKCPLHVTHRVLYKSFLSFCQWHIQLSGLQLGCNWRSTVTRVPSFSFAVLHLSLRAFAGSELTFPCSLGVSERRFFLDGPDQGKIKAAALLGGVCQSVFLWHRDTAEPSSSFVSGRFSPDSHSPLVTRQLTGVAMFRLDCFSFLSSVSSCEPVDTVTLSLCDSSDSWSEKGEKKILNQILRPFQHKWSWSSTVITGRVEINH